MTYILHYLTTLLFLCAGHALCDYPLQGDFLAKGKNHRNPLPGVPWYQCMLAHCLIHAGMVVAVTGKLGLGLAEFILHWITDTQKSDGNLSFNQDQGVHYACKVLWAIWL